ncbi:MAG TPA: adenylate/guanylate cyclase domain-containing protein [Alphaproteobacteria bacterium]|nr:adenylate/guanylate cyclase domain-containing protein [Alphaproteobacteria bacterium]
MAEVRVAARRFRFADRAANPLPERVRRAIESEQHQSEIVVGWVQMGAVLTFGTLYAVAPKTFSVDAPFAPVPWALAAYFLFTVLRLVLAYRRQLPGWFLAVSVAVDMTLLLVMIWSFHLQYGQPPAFYLKAPTMLYVFIFIALRALRFEARFVVLAGAIAAVGWLALVVYAATFDPGGMPVTRDYVRYMTSASILWGAEFDKIISILTVTAILSMALLRAQRVLVRAITEGTAAQDLKRFFAPEIAQKITGADQRIRPGEAELRPAVAMFVDLRGFTPLTRMLAPAEVMRLLADYQARMVRAIQANGGSIDKFLGDGILASFGAARPSPGYAAEALRAIEDIQNEARAWGEERVAAGKAAPRVGVAVASGEVLFGAVGDETRLEYTVIGDAVNLAAKLEKHTKVERVQALVDRQTYLLAVDQGFTPRGAVRDIAQARVDGVPTPIDLVAVG